jgi:adenylate kinase family enzyme
MDFPLFNTRALGTGNSYDLNDPVDRRKYFEDKLGSKLDDIKEFLDTGTFVGFMLAKKSAGKGTYSKMFAEVVGEHRVAHISVGDIVRQTHKLVADDPAERAKLIDYLRAGYRGFISVEECVDALVGRTQDKLIPTEFILALVKKEIDKVGRKAIFIDGFPRTLDQISYSLYFRSLINLRDDPDFFVLIDIPETIIDERMKHRVVCPSCNTSRNLRLLPTKFVEYDQPTATFHLLCDNKACTGYSQVRLVAKEGDDKGIESLKDRLALDGQLMDMATKLQGVPKILVRNAIPAEAVLEYTEPYEITPAYSYTYDTATEQVQTHQEPWIVKDDAAKDCNSLLAPPALLSMMTQMHSILIGNSKS